MPVIIPQPDGNSKIRSCFHGPKGDDFRVLINSSFPLFSVQSLEKRYGRRLRRVKLLHNFAHGLKEEFDDLIHDAFDAGLITLGDIEELMFSDAVARGEDAGSVVYFLGEIGVSVADSDIERAAYRANILSKATRATVCPIIIGETIPEGQRAKAELEQVELREIGPDFAEPFRAR